MANVAWFEELSRNDIGVAGGKGANLGEMTQMGVPVPPGFAVTAQAYQKFIEDAGLKSKISDILSKVNVDDADALNKASAKIRDIIKKGKMPEDIKKDIISAYEQLGKNVNQKDVPVAIRSSATAEDLPEASFAGQQDTYLNIQTSDGVLEAVQRCWASLFTSRAIFYREKNGFDHNQVLISIIVQKMVNAETAGVMFTAHPATGERDKVVIEANWGLGETVVSGSATPDVYVVEKATGKLLETTIGSKEFMHVRDPKTGETKEMPTPDDKRKAQCLNEEQMKRLAEFARKVEEHYNHPQDMEWAVEGDNIYLVQTRAITVLYGDSEKSGEEAGEDESSAEVLIKGLGAGPKTGSGIVKVVPKVEDIGKVKEGDVLVTKMTTPDWVPAMRKAAAIITNEGGVTCHAAIVSRELGIPCIVGTGNATEVLKDGMEVTVNGKKGVVLKGIVKVKEKADKPAATGGGGEIVTGTEIKVNLSIPEIAEKVAAETGADGVGLLRAEHMLLGIGKHPRKLLEEGGEDLMIEKFADGIRKVAEAFSHGKVFYRTLDLKTDEFKLLPGGDDEPVEPNPMIGWRGVRRFLDPARPEELEILRIELKAIKKLVDEGIKNIGVMIPMVQHPSEVRRFKEAVAEAGIKPHKDILIGLMIEVPSAAIAIEDFVAEGIDFVSFGTNDLTQFTLAVDRNNERIAPLYDERHPAVQWLLKHVIEVCNKADVETSICGQAGSYPDIAKKLVSYGIRSISANADAVHEVRKMVARTEQNLILSKMRELEKNE